MSNWITDRRPINDDEKYVFNQFGDLVHYFDIKDCEPWMRIERPEPYVKPKRFKVTIASGMIVVYDNTNGEEVAGYIPTPEAAERIAAIYNEAMP